MSDWDDIDNIDSGPKALSSEDLSKTAQLIELSKKRAYVRWELTYEDLVKKVKTYRMWFKRFARNDHRKGKMWLIDRADGITIRHDFFRKNKWSTDRYIFKCKNGKLHVFVVRGRKLTRRSPLMLDANISWEVLSLSDNVMEFPGILRNEKRLAKLLIKKCKQNGVEISKYMPPEDFFMDTVVNIYYPAICALREQKKVNLRQSRFEDTMAYFRKPLKQCIRGITGYNSKTITRLFIEAYKKNGFPSICKNLNITKSLLQTDYQQKILTSDHYLNYNLKKKPFVKFLSNFKGNYKFISGHFLENNVSYRLADSVNQYEKILAAKLDYKLPDTNNLEEIHDILTKDYKRIQHADRPINQPKRLLELNLHDQIIGQYVIKIPQTIHQLLDWGTSMSNCIGSYASYIESGHCWIIGLWNNSTGVIDFGVEIEPKSDTIRQFRGKHNCEPPEVLEELVIMRLVELKALNISQLKTLEKVQAEEPHQILI